MTEKWILVTSRQSNSIYATLDFGFDIAGITCYAPAFYAQLKAAEKEAYSIVEGKVDSSVWKENEQRPAEARRIIRKK